MKQPPFILSVCGKHQIDRFAGAQVTHLLSLEDPFTPKSTPGWFKGDHVQLHLHDLNDPSEATSAQAIVPTKEHVRQILRVGADCLKSAQASPAGSSQVHLLIHCYAGISRSTAAAFAITTQAIGVEHAPDALDFVLQIRPEAFPNSLIVRHADRLLSANGKLVAALEPLRQRFSALTDLWLSRRPSGLSDGPD